MRPTNGSNLSKLGYHAALLTLTILNLLSSSSMFIVKCDDETQSNSSNTSTTKTTTTAVTKVSDPLAQQLSGNIDVRIFLDPYKSYFGTIYVSTGVNLNLTSEIRDNNYKDKPLFYKWSLKDETIATGWNLSAIQYKFLKNFDDNFIKLEVFHENEQHQNETGSSQINIVVREPVSVTRVGKFFIEHGELLNVSIVLNGSTPFLYCYRICQEDSLIPCEFCITYETTYDPVISIKKYLQYVGNYTLYLDASNIINREVKHYTIRINQTAREETLPIVPIASSILAVLILLTGITLHLKFRKTADAETADFDFIGQGQEEEEWEYELSFIQRVKYIFCGADQDDFAERRQLL